ncbi:hypothetical protein BH23PAT1_BH23PAT1_1120 [soil metagenome]
MINKQHRFHGYGSLNYVYRHGKTVRGPMSALKFIANDRRDTYRLAVVVSKKVSKSAVVRNRIRRRLYEVFRLCEHEINQPYDIVMTIFSEDVATVPSAELNNIVAVQLKQAGIIPGRRGTNELSS